MKKFLMLFAIILSACDSAPDTLECVGHKLVSVDEMRAQLVLDGDIYVGLFRTESECGYRYSGRFDDTELILWDRCLDDWNLLIDGQAVPLCK
ncbi:MAG: hypothetical protein LBF37_01780 [Rickettsiales bacterium]|jgi:hypothetical protein|nr:hypothetical protein [Rickettsiales bacterium]